MDPAVFKDGDGPHYMYFGGIWGGQLQRWATGQYKAQDVYPAPDQPALTPKVARMRDDMLGFAEPVKDVVILDEQGKPLLAKDNARRFFEAAWVHKYGGKYYFSYSTGDTHFIVYATGDSPYGPFTYRGKILEPVLGWTNHHSIVEIKGKWYLFYHDSQQSGGQTHLRNVKVVRAESPRRRDDRDHRRVPGMRFPHSPIPLFPCSPIPPFPPFSRPESPPPAARQQARRTPAATFRRRRSRSPTAPPRRRGPASRPGPTLTRNAPSDDVSPSSRQVRSTPVTDT